jgi:hypothetical protein
MLSSRRNVVLACASSALTGGERRGICLEKDVDARHKAGHDEGERL